MSVWLAADAATAGGEGPEEHWRRVFAWEILLVGASSPRFASQAPELGLADHQVLLSHAAEGFAHIAAISKNRFELANEIDSVRSRIAEASDLAELNRIDEWVFHELAYPGDFAIHVINAIRAYLDNDSRVPFPFEANVARGLEREIATRFRFDEWDDLFDWFDPRTRSDDFDHVEESDASTWFERTVHRRAFRDLWATLPAILPSGGREALIEWAVRQLRATSGRVGLKVPSEDGVFPEG